MLSSLDLPDEEDAEYRDMLDRSWMSELAEYVTELLESVPLIQDTFMSSLCSINMDLAEVVEEDQLASADNLMD